MAKGGTATMKKGNPGKTQEKSTLMKVLSCWQLYVLMIPALVWLILFCYKPMYGVLIAFKDFKAREGIMASPWADPIWKYFDQFFSTSIAVTAIKNTIILSLEQLVINFPIPIIFALLLNQVKSNKARKFVQTVSYAPYFLSNVILVSVMNLLFGANGVVNALITGATGGSPVQFTSAAEYFRPMYIGSTVWQSMGFNAIVYIAALAGISPDFYEAAVVDGATKLQRIFYIDIPLIMPTVLLMLILAIGQIMGLGYEKAFLMQTSTNSTVSEIITTYTYKVGLQGAQYSFATAVGLFNSVVNFVILVLANFVSKKTADVSIF